MADKTKPHASQRKSPKTEERITVRAEVARKTVKSTEKASHSAPPMDGKKANGALKVKKRSKKELPDTLALFSEVYGRL